jgi:hypothetical protein
MGMLIDAFQAKRASDRRNAEGDEARDVEASIISTSMRDALFEASAIHEQRLAAEEARIKATLAENNGDEIGAFLNRSRALRYEAAALKTAAHVANLVGDAIFAGLGRNVVEKEGAEGAIEVADFLKLSHLISGRN